MYWKPYQQIFIVNLARRTDRLESCIAEFNKHKVNFTVFVAEDEPEHGAHGLWLTMIRLFNYAIKKEYPHIFVFEDDVRFVQDPNHYMENIMAELGTVPGWFMLNLGPNTHASLQHARKVNAYGYGLKHVLRLAHGRGTHAMIYSRAAMLHLVRSMATFPGHIDVYYERWLQPLGDCYCSYPLICTQKNDFSDIAGKEVDQSYIETRFYENTKHLVL